MENPNANYNRDELIKHWTLIQERLQKEAQGFQAENAILKGQLEKTSGEIKLKNEQISELFKKWQGGSMAFILKENSDLSRKLHEALSEVDRYKLEVQGLQNVLRDKDHQMSSVHSVLNENTDIKAKLLSAEAKVEELRGNVQSLHEQLMEKDRKIVAAQPLFQKNTELIQKLSSVDRKLDEYAQTIQELQKTIMDREYKLAQAQSALQENSALAQKLSAAELKNDELRQIVQSLQNTLMNNEFKLSHWEGQSKEKDSQLALLVRKVTELKNENVRLQSEIQKLHSEDVARYEERIREIAGIRQEHEAREQVLRQEMQKMESDFHEKDIELQKLNIQYGQLRLQYQQEYVKLQDENETLRAESPKIAVAEPLRAAPVSPASAPAPQKPAAVPTSVPASKGRKILLVESNPETSKLIIEALTRSSYQVSAINDTQKILEAARQPSIDLILMNVVSDDVDVFTLCREISQDSSARKVPVVIMASNPDMTQMLQEEAPQLIQSFLYKPFSIDEMISTIALAVSMAPVQKA